MLTAVDEQEELRLPADAVSERSEELAQKLAGGHMLSAEEREELMLLAVEQKLAQGQMLEPDELDLLQQHALLAEHNALNEKLAQGLLLSGEEVELLRAHAAQQKATEGELRGCGESRLMVRTTTLLAQVAASRRLGSATTPPPTRPFALASLAYGPPTAPPTLSSLPVTSAFAALSALALANRGFHSPSRLQPAGVLQFSGAAARREPPRGAPLPRSADPRARTRTAHRRRASG